MGPASFDPWALAGAIAGTDRQGTCGPRLLPDQQIRIGRAVGRRSFTGHRFDRHCRKQSRRNQCGAQIIDLAAVVQIACLEPSQYRDMFGIKGFLALAPDLPEHAARAGFDRQGIIPQPAFAIEQYVPLPNRGEGIAIFRQLDRNIGFGG